jgi:hypothetical protein
MVLTGMTTATATITKGKQMEKYVKVMGGYISGGSKEDEKGESSGVFMVKKTFVVRESELAGLFRREWELASMPVVKLCNTNERPR